MRQQYDSSLRRSRVTSSHHTAQWQWEKRKKEEERQPVTTALLMVTSKDKCWNTYWQNHYYFSLKAIFPFLLWWGKSPHGDPFWTGIQTRGCHNWSASAMDLNFTVTLTSSTRACSGICSTAQGHGHLVSHPRLPGRHSVSTGIRTTGHSTCWDPSLPKAVLPSEAFRAQCCFLQKASSQQHLWFWRIFR